MAEEQKSVGLAPVRTVRFVASLIALMGMVFFLLERILAAVLVMASDGVKLGLARYSNFTGRIAAQNFAEDKKLLGLLNEVNGILPTADSALTVLLVISIILLAVSLVALALPRQAVHVFVALKFLKWETGEACDSTGSSLRATFARIGNIPLKKIALPVGVVLAVVVVVLALSHCHDKVREYSVETSVKEMQEQALAYIMAQKAYFAKNNVVGGAKALELPDSLSTDAFEYKVSSARFSAVSKEAIGNCPAGSKWMVSASTKGFFTKELALSRSAPKDTACSRLTPDFKSLGRN